MESSTCRDACGEADASLGVVDGDGPAEMTEEAAEEAAVGNCSCSASWTGGVWKVWRKNEAGCGELAGWGWLLVGLNLSETASMQANKHSPLINFMMDEPAFSYRDCIQYPIVSLHLL